jgi:hypothetical protein
LSEELGNLGLGYFLQDPRENSAGRTCKKIKLSCSDIERQNLFANMREKRSLVFYCDMKLEWAGMNTQFAVHEMKELG